MGKRVGPQREARPARGAIPPPAGEMPALQKALLAIIAVALLAPMLLSPFGRDQGVFACAADVLRRGGALYRDYWDLKPPGVYYLYLLSFTAFGRTMLAPRLLDLIWTLSAAGVLAAVGARLLSPRTGLSGALLFLACYALGYGYWHSAQADGFASLPLALAVLAMLAAERRRSWWLAAGCGALIGAAIVLKLTLGLFLALPLIASVVSRGERWPLRLARASGYLAGCAAVVAGVALLLWRQGALRDLIEILFVWNSHYATIRSPAPALLVVAYQTWTFLFGGQYLALKLIGLLAAIGAADLVVRRGAAPEPLRPWLLPAWLAAMLVQVWIQGKYFQYHWLPVLPPLGLLAAQGMAALWRLLRQHVASAAAERAVAAGGLAVLVLSVAGAYWNHFRPELRYAAGLVPASEFLGEFRDRSDFSISADLAVASYLTAHTARGTPIFIWGFEPIVYFLADRPPASRFISQQPLVAPWSPREWRRELIAALEERRPAYVLVVHNDAMPWVTMRPYDSATELAAFPELVALLARDYQPAVRIEDFDIWQRR